MLTRHLTLTLLIALILLGLALRLYRLDAVALRGDEAFSAQNWAGLPLAESLRAIATIEPHPPLTYAIFRAWGRLFTLEQEWLLRLLPALTNLIGIPALFALGHRLHSRTAGLLAALLWACHPYQIWHAQDFRNYALWSGMSAVTLWLGLRLIQRRRRVDWALYATALLTAQFTFYFEALASGVLTLFVLLMRGRERRLLLPWLALHGGVLGAAGVTFLVLQGALIGSGGYTGTTDHLALDQLITRFLPALTFGETLPPEQSTLVGIAALVILGGGLLVLARVQRSAALLLFLLGVMPLLIVAALSLRLGIFNPRYVLLAAPAYTLIIALLAADGLRSPTRLRWLAGVLLAGWLGISALSLNYWYHDPAYLKAPGWRALTAYLNTRVRPDDLVIQTAVDAAFGYYYRGAALDIGLPDNFDQPSGEIEAYLAANTEHYHSVWVTARTFTTWPNAGVVENWVEAHMQRVRITQADELPIRQYMPWEVRPIELGAAPRATYGGAITLREAVILLPPEPTEELTVWLYWQPQAHTPRPLKVFVHLIRSTPEPTLGTMLAAQADALPQQGRVSSATWTLNTLYRDVYTLPLSAVSAGDYEVRVGWYDPEDGVRLTTTEGTDAVVIGQVHLPDEP